MRSEFKSYFSSTNREGKAIILAQLIHNLTISARGYYDEKAPEEKLKRINEIVHTASSKLGDILQQTPKQYPDGVFVDILFERSGICEPDLERALRFVTERTRV